MPNNDWATQASDGVGGAHLLHYRPYTYIAESFPRRNLSVFTPLSGYQYLSAVLYQKGQVVTKIGFWTGSTPAVTPTHWWTGLYAEDVAQGLPSYPTVKTMLRQSADQTTTALGAGAAFAPNLSSTYTIPATGMYLHAFCIVAATMPTIVADGSLSTVPAALKAANQRLCGREGSGAYTTPSAATLLTLTDTIQQFYAFAQ